MNEYVKKIAENRQIIIYGAGKIGMMVHNELQEYGLNHKIICYAVSDDIQDDMEEINGIKVKSIGQLKEYYDNTLFLVAVSDAALSEIENILINLGISNYFDARMIYIGKWRSFKSQELIDKYISAESGDWLSQPDTSDFISQVTCCMVPNAGDTMLSQCVRKFINYPRWNIIDVRQKVNNKIINKINHGKAVIIGGGGLFLPDTNENNISGWQWAISNEQLDQIRVPIIVYAVGYNYFKGQKPNKLFENSILKLIQRAEFIGLRNSGSIREVRKIVGEENGKKIIYQPCMTSMINKIYSFEKDRDSKIIGINIAFDREERRFGNEKEKILNEIAKALKEIQDMGYQVQYIAHTDADLRFLKYMDYYSVCYDVENLTNEFPDKIIETYKKLQCMIGMRGHAQMIPFGMGCRIITLGTHNKMRWFLDDVDMQDCYIDLLSDTSTIAKKIIDVFQENCVKHGARTDTRIKTQQDKLWHISCENKKIIISKIM